MDIETLYTIANMFVLPFWAMLVFIPHAKPTNWLVHSGVAPVILGLAYVYFLATAMLGEPPAGGGMDSLAALQIAFSDPRALLGAWIHYLVFDLFVGAWIVRDAKRHEVHHLAVVIPVLLTLMTGPFGLLLYLAIRAGWKRSFTLLETTSGPS